MGVRENRVLAMGFWIVLLFVAGLVCDVLILFSIVLSLWFKLRGKEHNGEVCLNPLKSEETDME